MHVSYSELPLPGYTTAEVIADAELTLKKVQEDIAQNTGGKITINFEVKLGTVIAGIEEYCNSVNLSLVIMGAEIGNAFERLIFGGKNLGAISQFPWRTIIVPPQAQFKMNKIGLACDLENVVETIRLSEIKSIVNEFGA